MQACVFQIGTTGTSFWECTRDRALPIKLHVGLTNNFPGRVFQS